MPRKQRFRPNRSRLRPASEIVDAMAKEADDRAFVVSRIAGAARGASLVERLKAIIADERDPEVAMLALTEFVRFTLQVCDVPVDAFVSRLTDGTKRAG